MEHDNLIDDVAVPSTSSPREAHFQKKRRPRNISMRLTIHSGPSMLPPSPLTPSSIFSFELTDSPGFHFPPSSARKYASSHTRQTPSSMFNFEFDLPPIEEMEGDESRAPSRRPSKVVPVTDWRSVRLVAFLVFIVRIQFTVYMGSFKPMVETMDPSMDVAFYSFIQGLYSAGVAASAPIFGVLANKYGFFRPSMFLYALMLCTNIAFLFMSNLQSHQKWYAMVIRFLVGIAAGGSSILNTYWVTVTQKKDGASAAAYTDAALSLGTGIGPLFQLAAAQFVQDYPGSLVGIVWLNLYSTPAIAASILSITAAIVMTCLFHEQVELPGNDNDNGSASDEDEKVELPKLDYFVIFICFFIRFIQFLFYANVETTNPSYIKWMFDLSDVDVTRLSSAIMSASGFLGFAFLVVYVWTGASKRMANRIGVILGFFICLIFLSGSFPFEHGSFIKSSSCSYKWCATTPSGSIPIFVTVYILLFAVGFPLLNVHASSMLAKQLAGRQQTHWHGISNCIGTLSRVIFSPILTIIFQNEGITVTWLIQIAIIVPVLVLLVLFYNRMGTPLDWGRLRCKKVFANSEEKSDCKEIIDK